MSTVYTNTFTVKKGSDSKPLTTPIDFYVLDVNDLELEKAVDKSDEVYASGDDIIFILTIKNKGVKITGAKVEDTINAVVAVSGYSINGGTIQTSTNDVAIEGLELSGGTPSEPSTTTIEIYGKIN